MNKSGFKRMPKNDHETLSRPLGLGESVRLISEEDQAATEKYE
jgi:hypothetical protein